MIASLYQYIEQLGYTHPFHPAATHIPAGCVIAAFLFLLASLWTRKPSYYQTARHCMGLALLFLPITALLGITDWQYHLGGAWITPIKIKLALALLLLLCLLALLSRRRKNSRPAGSHILSYGICLILVGAIGYFGGELVYDTQISKKENTAISAAVQNGANLFRKNCAFCHHHDQKSKKVGPGLKGIAKADTLPTSGWPLSEENLRKQLKTPFAEMPSFDHLKKQELDDLITFLQSL